MKRRGLLGVFVGTAAVAALPVAPAAARPSPEFNAQLDIRPDKNNWWQAYAWREFPNGDLYDIYTLAPTKAEAKAELERAVQGHAIFRDMVLVWRP